MESRTPSAGSQRDVEYWDIASKYWRDIATVNPHWAWDAFYSKKIPDREADILLLGVTDGSFLRLISEFRPRARVTGVDFSFKMIKNAQGVERNMVCCRGDFLPFRNESFDVVLSDYFFSVIPENVSGQTVEEIARMLRPKGVLLAKELRHRGHKILWSLLSSFAGALFAMTVFLVPSLAVFTGILFVLALLTYNPQKRRMGRSTAFCKFFLHLFRFAIKKKRLPTRKEARDLYYLSRKYLHIFTDEEMENLFSHTSLRTETDITPFAWNFSVVGVKQ